MHLTIYRMPRADEVRPGDTIHHPDPKKGPVVVEEKRETLEGIELVGHKPTHKSGRRVSVRLQPNETVRVYAAPEQASAVRDALFDAVAGAAADYKDRSDIAADAEGVEAPWDVAENGGDRVLHVNAGWSRGEVPGPLYRFTVEIEDPLTPMEAPGEDLGDDPPGDDG